MHPLYWLVDQLVIWILVSASVLSFVTLFFWVVQTMTIVTSMLIVISFVIVVIIVLTAFVIAMGYGRNRH
jgi:predicted neutral ceramidase superfamily lipid hydrolase